jgi:hypothetical protein
MRDPVVMAYRRHASSNAGGLAPPVLLDSILSSR